MLSNLINAIYNKDLGFKEVAAALGCSVNTVTNKLYSRSDLTLSEINALYRLLYPGDCLKPPIDWLLESREGY